MRKRVSINKSKTTAAFLKCRGYFSLSDSLCVRGCDQRYRRRFTRTRRPALYFLVIIPLNFALCAHPTHENRQVRSSLKADALSLGIPSAVIQRLLKGPFNCGFI